MGKQTLFLTIFVLSAALALPEGITVTFPRAGNNLYKQSSVNITWTGTDCSDPNVKINIFRNSIAQANFVEQLTGPNNGSKRWTVPGSYVTGNYILRVKTADNLCIGDSGVFIINEPLTIDRTVEVAGSGDDPQPPGTPVPVISPPKRIIPALNRNVLNVTVASIKINYPDKDTNWRLRLGDTALPFPIRIQWEKTGIGPQDDYVKIFLKRVVNGPHTTLLTQRTRNNGLFRGNIRRDLRTAMYTVIIQTIDGKIRVESAPFHITNAENDPD